MSPDDFRKLGEVARTTVGEPLRLKVVELEKEIGNLKSAESRHHRFMHWHRCLVHGETGSGFLGMATTYAMFVKSYRAIQPPDGQRNGSATLAEIALVIVPEFLIEHRLRIYVPVKGQPGVQTATSAPFGPKKIAARMMRDIAATNVSIGTFADVLHEPCRTCGKPAPIVALDEHVDDDDGQRARLVAQFCGTCLQVHELLETSDLFRKDK